MPLLSENAAIIDFTCAEFMFLTALGVLLSEIQGSRPNHYQFAFTLLVSVLLVVDGITSLPLFDTWGPARQMGVYTLHFALSYSTLALFHLFAVRLIEVYTDRRYAIRHLGPAMAVVAIGLWLAALPFDFFAHLTADGILISEPQRVITVIPAVVMIALDMAFVLRHRKQTPMITWSFLSIYLFLIVAFAILSVEADTVALSVALAILTFVVYIVVNVKKSQLLLEREQNLAQSRLDVALSQIQPHFLYNSLNSIYHLIDQDPQKAQEVVSDFSDYLRMNLDTISSGKLVPFSTELQHVRTYLNLEKMRFGDDLRIEEDIRSTSFFVPPLSIQPLVENAVKHGIHKKEDGGTVTISTRQVAKGWTVTVSDDGVGFDTEALAANANARVGLNNTATRLRDMCNATLDVKSEPGKGTTITVFIPGQEVPS